MKVGVVSFPGSNCDEDALLAVVERLREQAVRLWHKDHDLQGADIIILPGGFSYGDYLRAGAIARFSPIMQEVIAHAKRGGPVIGICNGFQIACEAGLLPGALLRNASLRFRSMPVTLRVESTQTVFTNAADTSKLLTMPIAHGDGRYTADEDVLDRLEAEGRVVFRYVDQLGAATDAANPNGSMRNIAGIANESGTVVGLMPHPERAMEPLLGSTDGLVLFESLLGAVKV
ncbi:MAG TPA: phosphoribosylformylglycinamidine synthase subunit PurQ [Gemmatimonadaceae bacterium]|nr:phosphoribosylformylglycinamidine synthase subunit PurQ [Gemmatimonadaceae bacterium]